MALYNPDLLGGGLVVVVGVRGGLGLDLGKGLVEPEHPAKLGNALSRSAAQNAPLGGTVVAVVLVHAEAVGAVLAGVHVAVALAAFTLAVALPVLIGLPVAIGAVALAIARTADVVVVVFGRPIAAPESAGALVVRFLAPTASTVAVVAGATPAVLERKRRVGGIPTGLAGDLAGDLAGTHDGLAWLVVVDLLYFPSWGWARQSSTYSKKKIVRKILT